MITPTLAGVRVSIFLAGGADHHRWDVVRGWFMNHSHKVGPPFTIAKLVNITPITMVYGTYNYSYWGL